MMFRNFIVVGYSLLSFLLPTCLFLQEKKWLFLLPALLIALVLDFKHKGIETLRCVNGVFVLVLFLAVALLRAISSPSPSEEIALIFYISLGITTCWVLCQQYFKQLFEKWFIPWVAFLFLSPVYARWSVFTDGRFSYIYYSLSLLAIVGIGLLLTRKFDHQKRHDTDRQTPVTGERT